MAVSTAPPIESRVTNGRQKDYTGALVALTSLFFMWGFLTSLNDILVPHLKGVFDLNYTQAMLIQFSFFMAYFIVSLPSGIIVEKIGYKNGIILGLTIAGIGCLVFYPAAGYKSYTLFLLALFILASGITVLQVAANPYVAILGKPSTASSRLNLTQAFNSLGTTLAPFFGSLLILSATAKTIEEEASAVQVPYIGLAIALFLIATIFFLLRLPKVEAQSDVEESDEITSEEYSSAWKYRHLILGALGIFIYVGAEVSIGSFLVNYLGMPNIAGLAEANAGKFVSFYWGGAMVGRFIGAAVQRKVKPGKVLAFNAVMASLLVVVSIMTTGTLAMWSILLVGLFNSIMFPTIFTLAIAGLGKHTGQASGILCAAIVGGALIPLFQGFVADNIGIQLAFIIPAVCYIYIAYYGWQGHKPVYKN